MRLFTRLAVGSLGLVLSGCLIDTVGQDPDRSRGGESALGGDDSGSGAGGEAPSQGGAGAGGSGGSGGEAPTLTYLAKVCPPGEVGLRFEIEDDEVSLVCGPVSQGEASRLVNRQCRLEFSSYSQTFDTSTVGVSTGTSCADDVGDRLPGCSFHAFADKTYYYAVVPVPIGTARGFRIDFECGDTDSSEVACDDVDRILTARRADGNGVCQRLGHLVMGAARQDCRMTFGLDAWPQSATPEVLGTSWSEGCEAPGENDCSPENTAVIPWANEGDYPTFSVAMSCATDDDKVEDSEACPDGYWVVGQTDVGDLVCSRVRAVLAPAFESCRPFAAIGLDCSAACTYATHSDGTLTDTIYSGIPPYIVAEGSALRISSDYLTVGESYAVSPDLLGIGFRCGQ